MKVVYFAGLSEPARKAILAYEDALNAEADARHHAAAASVRTVEARHDMVQAMLFEGALRKQE